MEMNEQCTVFVESCDKYAGLLAFAAPNLRFVANPKPSQPYCGGLMASRKQSADLAAAAEQVRPMPMAHRGQYLLYQLLPQSLFDHVCRWLYRIHVRLTYKV